mmetsp:Transcript_6369/g.11424  ORF Transcript_6369/g.11424 Transcript_6369/m.11424 type:complete len:101 (+) Transcript_6369:722-1024(+)
MVLPRVWCSSLSSRRSSARSLASRLESGSSNRNTPASRTSARPMATRWRWPPESCAGLRCNSALSCSMLAAFSTRRAISALGTPATRGPKLMFFSTVIVG